MTVLRLIDFCVSKLSLPCRKRTAESLLTRRVESSQSGHINAAVTVALKALKTLLIRGS